MSFLPSKENTEYYIQGTKPLSKIIIFVKHRPPKKEEIGAESGKEEKERGKWGTGRIKEMGNSGQDAGPSLFRIHE